MEQSFDDTPLAALNADPALASVRFGVCDLNGVLRGKRLPRAQAAKLLGGVPLPLSVSLVDLWGADLADSPYLRAGDPDGVARPTGTPALPMPWLDPPALLLPCWMEDAGGAPSPVDPRQILASVCARYRAADLTPVTAIELEFYLTDAQGEAPAGMAAEGVLDLDDLDRIEPFLAALDRAAGGFGLALGAALSEGGGGQVEVNLPHGPDPLVVADQVLMFRQMVRGVARAHGLRASFMAMPDPTRAGNGQHVHVSLCDGAGRNVFDDGTEAGSDRLAHAIGGVLAQMGAATLIFAPHGNSHRRLHRGHAPSQVTWALDSRFAAVRIPSGPAAARRLEHRVAGADANTYLVLAAILSAALDGIEAQTPPGAPLDGPDLPKGWVRARDSFAGSDAMARLMGDTAHGLYLALRDQEQARMEAPLGPLERATLSEAL